MDSDRRAEEELERLRAEVAEWRRRAELAEAVAAERLARAESAERALSTAEAALHRLDPPDMPVSRATRPVADVTEDPKADQTVAPKSWLERWRRYTDSIT